MTITQNNFAKYLFAINVCYSESSQEMLPKPSDFPVSLFGSDNLLNLNSLLDFAKSQTNPYLISVSKRIVGVYKIQESREAKIDLDIKSTWKLISESILIIPNENIVSSIGSQGFLSIPLYKCDKEKENFEFIRLHIWDKSLSEYFNEETFEKFSIHTHSFFAKSWIVSGKLVNDRYSVIRSADTQDYTLFTIGYNKSLNEINQHTSSANNTKINVLVKQISHEIYLSGGTYDIEAGKYHKSISLQDNGSSCTFFSFTAKDGLVDQSYVVGPSEIQNSTINRKMHINPAQLLAILDKQINNNE